MQREVKLGQLADFAGFCGRFADIAHIAPRQIRTPCYQSRLT